MSTNCTRAFASLDPETAANIDRKNKRRLVARPRDLFLTGGPRFHPANAVENEEPVAVTAGRTNEIAGVFVFRDRADLFGQIDRRVHAIFQRGVVDEVRAALGKVGVTAAKTLGLRQIRNLIAGQISEPDAIASIQQATRQYAKRQLTWFRRQTNFEPLNLSLQRIDAAPSNRSCKSRSAFAHMND